METTKPLRVIVFGATGGTGLQFCRQAADAGHAVTAYVRNPDKLTVRHANISCVKGTLDDPATVEGAVRDKEAVVISLGGQTMLSRDAASSNGTRVILGAVKNTGVRRVVFCSSFGAGSENRKLISWPIRTMLSYILADKDEQEADVRKSDADWIIVRPVRLCDDPARGKVHAQLSGQPPATVLSRADLAAFLVGQLDDQTYVRQSPTVSWFA